MTGDNSKESPKGSDEGLERRKLAGKVASDKSEAISQPDANAKEQAEASKILSEAANKNPQEPESKPMPELVAMQGVLDTSVGTAEPVGDKLAGNDTTAAGDGPRPIKTPDDMYERMFDSNRSQESKDTWQDEGKTKFTIGAQFWKEVPAKEQSLEAKTSKIAPVDSKTAEDAKAKMAAADSSVKDAIIISDMTNAHVPLNTEKVVLHVSARESVYKEPVAKESLPHTIAKKEKETLPKIAQVKEGKDKATQEVAQSPARDVGKRASDVTAPIAKVNDTRAPVSELNLATDNSSGSGRAIDKSGNTIGYWYGNGQKLVMSLSVEVSLKSNTPADATDKSKPAAKGPQIASTATTPTSTGKPSSVKESFAPPDTTNISTREVTTAQPSDTRQIPAAAQTGTQQSNEIAAKPNADVHNRPVDIKQTTEKVIKQDVAEQPTRMVADAHIDKAGENIRKAIAPVQEHADTKHPLGTVLTQKASAVQRDVHDVLSSKGAKQEKAVTALESSVKDYNKFLESNKATAQVADKLKVSTADVDVLRSAVNAGRLESPQNNEIQQSKLASSIDGLYALRDQAHANLLKTIDLIEQSKDQNLISRLFQTAMMLSFATNRDLSTAAYADISAATLSRAISDSSSTISHPAVSDIAAKMDFAPDRDTFTVSQESRSGATPINVSQANAQAQTTDGQAVRLDNAVDPVFGALALNAGTYQSYETLTRMIEERAETQRLYQELPDWMKEKGFRIALSPGTPPPAESTNKPVVAFVQRIRGVAAGDARIVAPTFKPLSTLGDRHTLTGQLQGIPRVLGGFDAVSLAQYNHLMQLLQTADDKSAAKAAKTQGVAVATQPDNLLKLYPFLGPGNQRHQSALFAKPDSRVDFGPSYSQASGPAATVAVVASATGQEPPAAKNTLAANQDEET